MSGGHWDYRQYQIEDMATDIERIIELDCAESGPVLERFEKAAKTLRMAAAMAHRIDWLLSGDDSEETFLARWDKDMAKLGNAD